MDADGDAADARGIGDCVEAAGGVVAGPEAELCVMVEK